MLSNDRLRTATVRSGIAAVVGAVVVGGLLYVQDRPADVMLTAGTGNDCLQFSGDGGASWGGVEAVPLDTSFSPVPGGEYQQSDFLIRNNCESEATLQVFAGQWETTDGGSATVRADLAGAAGAAEVIAGSGAPVLLNEISGLAPAESVAVQLYPGIPAAETLQAYEINPAWAFTLSGEDIVAPPAAPGDLTVRPADPTTKDNLVVTGTAEPGSTVTVYADGEEKCTTVAEPDGTFSCSIGTLGRGMHVITATAGNDAGTSDPSSTLVQVAAHGGTGSIGGGFIYCGLLCGIGIGVGLGLVGLGAVAVGAVIIGGVAVLGVLGAIYLLHHVPHAGGSLDIPAMIDRWLHDHDFDHGQTDHQHRPLPAVPGLPQLPPAPVLPGQGQSWSVSGEIDVDIPQLGFFARASASIRGVIGELWADVEADAMVHLPSTTIRIGG